LIFVRGDPLASLNSLPDAIFGFGSINGCQNFLRVSKKFRIVIGMETSELIR
jgi:hypothetical protein